MPALRRIKVLLVGGSALVFGWAAAEALVGDLAPRFGAQWRSGSRRIIVATAAVAASTVYWWPPQSPSYNDLNIILALLAATVCLRMTATTGALRRRLQFAALGALLVLMV